MTGQQLSADIYIGPTYYMRLKHMVKDKINFRARGPNTMLTRQPVQGRANDGGLRIGEMERDGVMGHGMSYFLNESFMVRGEKQDFYIAICNKTGSIAIYNEARNLFLSPLVDGPIKFNVNPDGSQSIMNLSRFGRSFSILRVPYAFKLLMQELQCLNVQMRIITDENVDQLLSMSFSDNINKLAQINNSNLDEAVKNINLGIVNGLRKPEEKRDNDLSESPVIPEPVAIDANSETMSEETITPYNPIEFSGPESPEQPPQQLNHQIPIHQMTSKYQYITNSPPSPRQLGPTLQPQYDSNSPGYDPQNTPSSPGYDPKNTPPEKSSILEVTPPSNNESENNSSTENGEEQNKSSEESTSNSNNSSEIKKIII